MGTVNLGQGDPGPQGEPGVIPLNPEFDSAVIGSEDLPLVNIALFVTSPVGAEAPTLVVKAGVFQTTNVFEIRDSSDGVSLSVSEFGNLSVAGNLSAMGELSGFTTRSYGAGGNGGSHQLYAANASDAVELKAPAELTPHTLFLPDAPGEGALWRDGDTGQLSYAQAAAIADIPDPSSATAEDCANKINEILAAYRAAGFQAT
jgi:hypothetical protein